MAGKVFDVDGNELPQELVDSLEPDELAALQAQDDGEEALNYNGLDRVTDDGDEEQQTKGEAEQGQANTDEGADDLPISLDGDLTEEEFNALFAVKQPAGEGDQAGAEGSETGSDGKDDKKPSDQEQGTDDGDGSDDQAGNGQDQGSDKQPNQTPPADDQSHEQDQQSGSEKSVQERVEEIDSQIDAIADQLDNGEITQRQYVQQTRKLTREQNEILMQSHEAQQAQQQAETKWTNDCKTFFEEKSDFFGSSSPKDMNQNLLTAFDSHVRENTGKAVKEGRPFGRAELDLALQQTIDGFKGLLTDEQIAAFETKAGLKKATAKEQQPKKTPPKEHKAPVTLNKVPASNNSEGNDEFAALDKLQSANSPKYQEALDMLAVKDPAALERYMER